MDDIRIYLVTFAHGHYTRYQDILDKTHQTANISEHIKWNREMLKKTNFFKHNKNILLNRKGCGLWAWKPFIIYDALNRVNTGDFVYYQDCFPDDMGFQYSVLPVINFMNYNNIDILPGFQEDMPIKHYIKLNLHQHFNITNDFLNKKQTCASPIFVRKTESTVKIIKEWMELSVRPEFIKHEPNPTKKFHNYDMSIFNCIMFKYNINPIDIIVGKRNSKFYNLFLSSFLNQNLKLRN